MLLEVSLESGNRSRRRVGRIQLEIDPLLLEARAQGRGIGQPRVAGDGCG